MEVRADHSARALDIDMRLFPQRMVMTRQVLCTGSKRRSVNGASM